MKVKDYSPEARKIRRERRRKLRIAKDITLVTLVISLIVTAGVFINKYSDSKDECSELKKTVTTQTDKIEQLTKDLEKETFDKKEYEVLKNRKELYDEYSYVLVDESGNRTDMTYEQLEYGIGLMEKEGIDPDMLFSIIMVESRAHEDAANSSSTARGYCQILESTARSMYASLGRDPSQYNHEAMATDGKLNMELGVELISRNMEKYDGDVDKVMSLYTGGVSRGYYDRLEKYLNKGGTSMNGLKESYVKPSV